MSDVVRRCLELIRSAPDCEDSGDFVLEAIELAKELDGSLKRTPSVVDCEVCGGTGEWSGGGGVCLGCNGTGGRPWTPISGENHMVRNIHELTGARIKLVQVREGRFVSSRGHNAYEVFINTESDDVYVIDGDHDSGPDITKCDEVSPPLEEEREW